MITLLYAVTLYVFVFGIDYLFYVKQKSRYNYVSRRTYGLFMLGQFAAIWLFYDLFKPFLTNWHVELAFLSAFAVLMLLFTYLLAHDKVYVHNVGSRTLQYLTPGYVVVKGAEIVFQEMIYLIIALTLASLLGINLLTYLTYIVILLIIHTVVVLGRRQSIVKTLTFGLFAISVPIFYIYITRFVLASGVLTWHYVYILLDYFHKL